MKFKMLHTILMSKGYFIVRESKHHIYSNGSRCIAVPHAKEIAIGTLRNIYKQMFPNSIDTANKAMKLDLGKAA